MALTKQEILQGTQARRTIPVEALKGEVVIRPLTDVEYHETQMRFVSAIKLGFELTGDDFASDKAPTAEELASRLNTQFDIALFADAEHEMNLIAAAYGLSVGEETWTPEEVGQLPPGASEVIAKEVFELSGARPEQEVMLQRFRQDRKRPRNRTATAVRNTVSAEPEGSDSGAADSPSSDSEAVVLNSGADGKE